MSELDLTPFGFTPTESRVYQVLLGDGPGTGYAIARSAGLARVVSNGTHYTLANLAASVSPFPGGDLYLGFAYNETLDTRADQRVRGWGPTMRWKIRGATYLDAGYSAVDSTSPSQDVHSRVFTARSVVSCHAL